MDRALQVIDIQNTQRELADILKKLSRCNGNCFPSSFKLPKEYQEHIAQMLCGYGYSVLSIQESLDDPNTLEVCVRRYRRGG